MLGLLPFLRGMAHGMNFFLTGETPSAILIACANLESAITQREITNRIVTLDAHKKVDEYANGCISQYMVILPTSIEETNIPPVVASNNFGEARYYKARIKIQSGSFKNREALVYVQLSSQDISELKRLGLLREF